MGVFLSFQLSDSDITMKIKTYAQTGNLKSLPTKYPKMALEKMAELEWYEYFVHHLGIICLVPSMYLVIFKTTFCGRRYGIRMSLSKFSPGTNNFSFDS